MISLAGSWDAHYGGHIRLRNGAEHAEVKTDWLHR